MHIHLWKKIGTKSDRFLVIFELSVSGCLAGSCLAAQVELAPTVTYALLVTFLLPSNRNRLVGGASFVGAVSPLSVWEGVRPSYPNIALYTRNSNSRQNFRDTFALRDIFVLWTAIIIIKENTNWFAFHWLLKFWIETKENEIERCLNYTTDIQ